MKIEEEATPGTVAAADPSSGARPPLDEPPVTVYRARRPRKPWTVWRVVRWALLVVLLAVASVAGYVAVHVYNNYKRIIAPSAETKGTGKLLDSPPSTPAGVSVPPATFLVLGYDHRAADGGGPSRSDTIMLVHVDPTKRFVTMMSFPRDMAVDIPGYGTQKINQAFTYGKGALTIRTIKGFMAANGVPDLRINYIVTVNFRGFVQTVDAYHGIYLNGDQRYYRQTGYGLDNWSSIDLLPGYRDFNGTQALSYVRYRHTDNDVYRLARQQAFVREFRKRIGVVNSLENILHLTDIAGGNIHVNGATGHTMGPTTMLHYAQLLTSIPRQNMLQVRLLGDQGANGTNGSFVYVGGQEVQRDVAQFLAPDLRAASVVANTVIGGRAAGRQASAKPAVKPIAPARLRVMTLNASGKPFAAATAAQSLRQAGWSHAAVGASRATGTGNMPGPHVYSSHVYYTTPRALASARQIQIALGDATAPQPLPTRLSALRPVSDVVAAIGVAFQSVTPPAQQQSLTNLVPAHERPQTEPGPASELPAYRALQNKLRYRILYPTRLPAGTVIGEPIVTSYPTPVAYRLHGGWAAHMTVHRNYVSSPQYVFGVQWTTWTSAPILDAPSVPPRSFANGRVWRLYFNGGHIHRIAVYWKPPKSKATVVTWIDNSLSDEYSNETMKAIAQGLMPVPRR